MKSSSSPSYLNIRTNDSGWNMVGWSLPMPRHHRHVDFAGNTPENQLGFAARGAVGGLGNNPEVATNLGDQIWIYNGGWKGYYLLGDGGAGWENVSNRWFEIGAYKFGDFTLEPGMGFLYYHPSSNQFNPTNFTWRPEYP